MPNYSGVSVYGGGAIYGASATDYAQQGAAGARPGPLSGNQAALGAGVLNTVITHLQPAGCTNNAALRAGSDFLNWLGPTGQSIITAAGFLADPLAGAALSVGMTEYQQAFGQSCSSTPYAPTARVAAGTAPPVPVASGGAPGVLSQGGGGAGGDAGVAAWMHATAHWCVYNPLFLVRVMPEYGGDDAVSAFGSLALADPAGRVSGESTVVWLRRVCPAFNWQVGGVASSIDGQHPPGTMVFAGVDSLGLSNGFVVWPWDLFAEMEKWQHPFMDDFDAHYKFTPSSGGAELSTLGELKTAMAAWGWTWVQAQ